ncbi:transcription termination factor Rho [Fusobacterium necrophorum]|uniref:Transcription termination factor Rho n=2 Tax=Fusobacterium necrophorum TaxID=859 RepID=A0AB73BYK7_9FUSO|nr:transcription termination factor Rho [Fusobacterium necrophorum]AYZ73166.1 transcription termination factor Rho [Fusobacterium necrophorum]AZW08837.1 transcription termination factor Rho [Fusobacterium necrophorum subsp. necrophorum]KDE65113.1 transcription termination factor Rho [Fusobacterium necrophorum BL]KDE68120.1 transcription termination factor Rho [Fusobacterium necrophorum DJ-1]KDE69284.1 transcription termination factor Rho [Fusobacterium necrophorum DJ-2]
MEILESFLINELYDVAKQLGVPCKKGLKKGELKILLEKYFDENPNHTMASGYLEVLSDGYGFLRNTSVEKDIYISASQIRKFKLRTGDVVMGEVRRPTGEEKNFAVTKVLRVNNGNLAAAESRIPFEELTPAYPTEQFHLETGKESISGRMIDVIAPIGKGQRALIVAPPKAGKTMLISSVANSLIQNYPKTEVWILLIDERPEEVTDIKENVTGAEVYASTFDEDPRNHIKVTESILEKAKRKVEDGEDIVILMDSLTRLARAYNIIIPSSGKLISGGIDPTALYYPKNFFGTARNIRGGGSLTIIATVLIDTGSKMDDVIYEEFKSTGNCEIHLDRHLSELRIFPAIDIQKSGTRKEELLIGKRKLDKVWKIRRMLSKMDRATAAQTLIRGMRKTDNNESLLSLFIKEGEH